MQIKYIIIILIYYTTLYVAVTGILLYLLGQKAKWLVCYLTGFMVFGTADAGRTCCNTCILLQNYYTKSSDHIFKTILLQAENGN